MVREEPADRVFIVFFSCSCASVFRFVSLVVFGWEEFVGKSARGGGQSARHGRSASVQRTDHFSRCSTRSSGGIFGRPALCLRTVRLASADSPPPSRERSTPGCAGRLSPLLLELCFRVALSSGLFLGLVGLL
jgi:hypothetical protein